jgi:regulator of nonsense transcripts 2
VELPSDSNFAVAMKHQQQAEKEEQQRIKNLVLNYDLRESEDQDGNMEPDAPSHSSSVHSSSRLGSERPSTYHHNRFDNKQGKNNGQRTRKLQLSDVADWYDTPSDATFEHRDYNKRTHWNQNSSRRRRDDSVCC